MAATTTHVDQSVPLLSLRAVTKNFGNLVAISDISLDIFPGEVVALVGDNGAGKSTLMKVMNGFYTPDAGTLLFKGAQVRFVSPAAARAVGIETVYQDLALVPGLSLWRNFFLGRELRDHIGPLPRLASGRMRHITGEVLEEIGFTRLRSPDETVEILSGGERQGLAIARANYFGGQLLLLDEPTSALSVHEVQKVAEAILRARHNGSGIVIIDHNIAHVHGIADRIIVLETGRVIETLRRSDITPHELSALVGRRSVAVQRN